MYNCDNEPGAEGIHQCPGLLHARIHFASLEHLCIPLQSWSEFCKHLCVIMIKSHYVKKIFFGWISNILFVLIILKRPGKRSPGGETTSLVFNILCHFHTLSYFVEIFACGIYEPCQISDWQLFLLSKTLCLHWCNKTIVGIVHFTGSRAQSKKILQCSTHFLSSGSSISFVYIKSSVWYLIRAFTVLSEWLQERNTGAFCSPNQPCKHSSKICWTCVLQFSQRCS